MTDALYGAHNDAEEATGELTLGADLSQHATMAGMLIGPVITDQGMRDGIRDAAAAALGDAGIEAVTLHYATFEGDLGKVTLDPSELVEVFLSRLGTEFGFSIPGYLTLEAATN